MNPATQQRLIALIAALLTTLLIGTAAGWFAVQRYYSHRLSDAEYLEQRLEAISGGGNRGNSDDRPPVLVRVGTAERRMVRPTRKLVGRLVEVRKVVVVPLRFSLVLDAKLTALGLLRREAAQGPGPAKDS